MKEKNYLQVAPHTKDFTLLHCRNNWGVTSSLTCADRAWAIFYIVSPNCLPLCVLIKGRIGKF